jgi:hypothetical protein
MSLLIACHFGLDKPSWMDNGPLQEDMLNQVKREVKEKAAMRRTLGYMREAEIVKHEQPLRSQKRRQADADAGAETRYTLPQHGMDRGKAINKGGFPFLCLVGRTSWSSPPQYTYILASF